MRLDHILNDMKDLNRIKLVLVENGETGKRLAEQLGKNTCTVSKRCTNSSQPNLYTFERIATLCGMEKKNLLT